MFEEEKKNFLGIKNFKENKSSVVIIPYPLENTVTYGKGTRKGPEEIIKASHQIELYDEDLKYQITDNINIETLKTPSLKKTNNKSLKELEKIIINTLNKKKFPFILGGEHSITIGAINAFAKLEKEVTIIQFDAHADLRDSYESNKYSHACVMRRCLDNQNVNLISIGIRSISKEEMSYLNKNHSRIKIFYSKDKKKWNHKEIINLIKNKNVYISFDVDVFDPSLMPATGTPEPNGILWDEAIALLQVIARNSNVIGADINELAPIKSIHSCNFIVAKIVYKLIGMIFHYK